MVLHMHLPRRTQEGRSWAQMPEAPPPRPPRPTPPACSPTRPTPPTPQHAQQRPGQEPQQASAGYGHGTRVSAPHLGVGTRGLDTGGWWSSCLAAGSLGAAAPAWRPGRSSAHPAGHTASPHCLRADDGCPRKCPSCVEIYGVRRAQCVMWARGVVVSHPLSMRGALGSIPSVSSGMTPLPAGLPWHRGPWNMHLPRGKHERRP